MPRHSDLSQVRARPPMFFGKYELLARLRVGGMAEVYKACAVGAAEAPLAIKRILPSFTDEADYVAMFLDEARLALRFEHPNIVKATELGQEEDNFYIALDYVAGLDLAAILRRARERAEPLPVALALRIAIEICDALHYAHELADEAGEPLGIVHRDVSPPNVLLSWDGDVKLIDFGIAKSSEQLMRTQAGFLKGKHGYLSPEQAEGQEVDRRSDIFSLGICLYEMLTAQRLFRGASDFSTLMLVRKAEIPEIAAHNSKVPPELEAALLAALAKKPKDRPESALQLRDELMRIAERYPSSAEELSAYVRERFADAYARELAGGEPEFVVAPDETTGLLDAFDDLDPVSTISTLAEMPGNDDGQDDGLEAFSDGEQPLPAEILPEILPVNPADVTEVPDDEEDDQVLEGEAADLSAPAEGDAGADSTAAVSEDAGAVAEIAGPSEEVAEVAPAEGGHQAPTGVDVEAETAASEPADDGDATAADAELAAEAVADEASDSAADPLAEPQDAASEEPAPAPPAAATLPGLGIDWDDEELSTQIYDAPEEEHGVPLIATPMPGPNAAHAAGSLPVVGQLAPFHVHSAGAARAEAYVPRTPPVQAPAPALSTLPPAMQAPSAGRAPLWVAVGLLAVALLGAGAYAWSRSREGGTINLTTTPVDARVTLDGRPAGSNASPFVLTDVPPGVAHELVVEREGYQTWRTTMTLRAGQQARLPHVALVPKDAKPAAAAPAPAQAPTPAKAMQGAAPERAAPVEKPTPTPGPAAPQQAVTRTASPRVAPKPRPPATPPAPISSARTSPPPVAPAPRQDARTERPEVQAAAGDTGILRVNSRPWSQVFVDGRLIGNTPQMRLTLSAGRHTITLVNPEFDLRKVITINLGAGETVTRVEDLTQ